MRVQFRPRRVRLLEARARTAQTVFAQRRRAPSLVPRRPSNGRRHILQLQFWPRRWFLSALRRLRERRRVRRPLQRSRRAPLPRQVLSGRTHPGAPSRSHDVRISRRISDVRISRRISHQRHATLAVALAPHSSLVVCARDSRSSSPRDADAPEPRASRPSPRGARHTSTRRRAARPRDDETTIERRRGRRGRERDAERGKTRARDDGDDRRESDGRRRRAWRRARRARRDATRRDATARWPPNRDARAGRTRDDDDGRERVASDRARAKARTARLKKRRARRIRRARGTR